MRKLSWLIVLLVCPAAGAVAQDKLAEAERDEARSNPAAAIFRGALNNAITSFKQLGPWEEHHGYLMNAMDKFFDRNGWNSEPDLFAHELVRSVESIPPWEFDRRFDKFMEVVGRRYSLDQEQSGWLRDRMIDESRQMFLRNGTRMFPLVMELVQTRIAGEPITAEQVARWSQQVAPVIEDTRDRMNVIVGDFEQVLRPEQVDVLHVDAAAANRRVERVSELRTQWAAGNWTPEAWGIEEDPIQLGRREEAGAAPQRESSGAKPAAADEKRGAPVSDDAAEPAASDESGDAAKPDTEDASPPPASEARPRPARAPRDADPWAAYVREFVARFRLDDAQQQRAWLVYDDARTHREAVSRRYEAALKSAQQRAAGADADDKARRALRDLEQRRNGSVEDVFGQMKRRLDRLPTRAQRKDAEDAAPKPATRPVDSRTHDGP